MGGIFGNMFDFNNDEVRITIRKWEYMETSTGHGYQYHYKIPTGNQTEGGGET